MSVLDFEAQWCRAELERMRLNGELQFADWFDDPISITEKNMDRDLKAEAAALKAEAEQKEKEAQQLKTRATALLDAHAKHEAELEALKSNS